MDAERYKKMMSILDAALDAAASDRSGIIAGLCGGDTDLRSDVEAMLEQSTAASSFLEDRPEPFSGDAARIGSTLGKYLLTEQLGSGGMGAVYLAERCDGAFDQTVAIKLLRRGMDSESLVKRFLNERRILAGFEHPGIARLIDGGTTDDGVPYFVMEYVDGVPIDDYVSQKELFINERLRLFIQVCDAVEYAHTRRIIHRDIKPSNVLVSDQGRPKLLDFGIAKSTEATEGVTVTETAWRLLTPEYASPEQIRGDTLTHRTDIYSLGVLLFELLTGRGPYRFSSRSPLEMARTICEQEPDLPSRVNKMTNGRSENGRPDTGRFRTDQRLSTDIDRIVLTALQKDPTRRYETAAAFAADIERHLTGSRIKAPGVNRVERLTRNVRQRVVWRPAFTFAAVLLVAAVSFAGAFWLNTREPSTPKINSLAVLPFRYEGEGDFSIGPGIAEGLIASLGRTRRFDIRPIRAVMNYAPAEVRDLRLIGETLNVDAILDGSIRRSGDELEVAATLFDPRAGVDVWTHQFRLPQRDVARIQQEIYRQLARRLSLPQDSRTSRTRSAEAYEAFLKGRAQWNKRNPDGYTKAIGFFDQAIAIDSEYAEAYAGLADAYALLSCVVEQFEKRAERMKVARQYAEKAIALDSTLAQPWATIGFIGWHYEWDWQGSDEAFRKAIELDPSYPTGHHWYSLLLVRINRTDEAVAEIKRAHELDPLSAVIAHDVGEILLWARRYDETIEAGSKAAKLDQNPSIPWYVPVAYYLKGDRQTALNLCLRAVEDSKRESGALERLAHAYYHTGDLTNARAIFAELRKRPGFRSLPDPTVHLSRAMDLKRTYAWLDSELRFRGAGITEIANHPRHDWCREDPQIKEYIRVTGLSDYALPAAQ